MLPGDERWRWLIGIPLGHARRQPAGQPAATASVTAIASLGIAVPNFWLAMILVLFFALELGWFPATGAASRSARSPA